MAHNTSNTVSWSDTTGDEVIPMKLTRVDTRIVTIPVEKPYVYSHGTLHAFSNVLVQIWTDEGIVGFRLWRRSEGGDA